MNLPLKYIEYKYNVQLMFTKKLVVFSPYHNIILFTFCRYNFMLMRKLTDQWVRSQLQDFVTRIAGAYSNRHASLRKMLELDYKLI